jgi:hypothetical protein
MEQKMKAVVRNAYGSVDVLRLAVVDRPFLVRSPSQLCALAGLFWKFLTVASRLFMLLLCQFRVTRLVDALKWSRARRASEGAARALGAR